MKAEVLGSLNPKLAGLPAKDIRRMEQRPWWGDVEPIGIGPQEQCYQALLSFALEYGLKPKMRPIYQSYCILPIAGSVGWHSDPGIGLILNWLIHETPVGRKGDYHPMQLIYPNGAIDVSPSQVFLFNGNQGHAWYSNNRCTLVQMTVTKTRSRKT
jgi:hypothetical protein